MMIKLNRINWEIQYIFMYSIMHLVRYIYYYLSFHPLTVRDVQRLLKRLRFLLLYP